MLGQKKLKSCKWYIVHCKLKIIIFFGQKFQNNNVTGRYPLPSIFKLFLLQNLKREITQFSYFENLKLQNCPFSKWQFAPFQYCNKIQKPADLNQWSPNKTIKNIF